MSGLEIRWFAVFRRVGTLWIGGVVALLFILALSAALFVYWRQEPLRKVSRLAENIEGVELVAIRAYDEFFKIDGVAILLDVRGHRIGFDSVKPSDFVSSDKIRVFQIDSWGFEQSGYDPGDTPDPRRFGSSYDSCVNIGIEGSFGACFSPPIRNITEALYRIDEIVLLLDKLPMSEPGLRTEWRGEILYSKKIRIEGDQVHDDFFPDGR